MENEILEGETLIEEQNLIAENQIAFDLDNLPKEIEEEESSSLPETAFVQKDYEYLAKDILFVVVKCDGKDKFSSFNLDLCGRPMIDWVVMAGSGCQTKIVADNANILEVLKAIKTDKPYMCVLFSDTPLMYKGLVYKIMDYFVRNRLNVLSLLRGYVFRTEFLANMDKFMGGCVEEFDKSAFARVSDAQSYIDAIKILQRRIIAFHEKNGVIFVDKKSTIVDADVEINEGVIIKANNILKGNTIICKNVLLEEGNVISNSVIEEDSDLLACKIVDSNVTSGKKFIAKNIANAKV